MHVTREQIMRVTIKQGRTVNCALDVIGSKPITPQHLEVLIQNEKRTVDEQSNQVALDGDEITADIIYSGKDKLNKAADIARYWNGHPGSVVVAGVCIGHINIESYPAYAFQEVTRA